jgi:hypothetical protein
VLTIQYHNVSQEQRSSERLLQRHIELLLILKHPRQDKMAPNGSLGLLADAAQPLPCKTTIALNPSGEGAIPDRIEIPERLTFTLPDPVEDLPGVPVRAVHCLDGHGNSGLTLLYSNHLGVERLVPLAKGMMQQIGLPSDCQDEDGDSDDATWPCERKALEMARWMGAGHDAYVNAVTSPVPPEIMKLKPGEAAFNTEMHADAVNALLDHGIITDTGKTVQLGYYKFPICMIHAPQTGNAIMDINERFKAYVTFMESTRRIDSTLPTCGKCHRCQELARGKNPGRPTNTDTQEDDYSTLPTCGKCLRCQERAREKAVGLLPEASAFDDRELRFMLEDEDIVDFARMMVDMSEDEDDVDFANFDWGFLGDST